MVVSTIQKLNLDSRPKQEVTLPSDAVPLWIDHDTDTGGTSLYYRLNNPENARKFAKSCIFSLITHGKTELPSDARFLNTYREQKNDLVRHGFYTKNACPP